MNRVRHATVCLLLSCLVIAGAAAQGFKKTYDWTIDLETEPVKGRLEFPGSKFTDLTRIKVFYHKGSKVDATKRTHYEDLWYRESQLIGCRRDHGFGLKPGEHLVIRVKHKDNASTGEAHAASDAIIRTVIDAYANGNMTSAVVVPAESFSEIVQGLGRLKFFPAQPPKPDEPVYTIMVLNLYSDPEGNEQVMHYAGETSGN